MRRKLFATNAISEQVLTDAQNNEEKSKLAVQVARDKLKFLGLDDDAIGLVGKEDGRSESTADSPSTCGRNRQRGRRESRESLRYDECADDSQRDVVRAADTPLR